MKKLFVLILAVFAATCCLSACGSSGAENSGASNPTSSTSGTAEGSTSNSAPELDTTLSECAFTAFAAQDFDGKAVDQSMFAGHKVTMINIWATWCVPCTEEMPALGKLHEKYSESRFQVVGVALDTVDANYNKNFTAFNTAKKIIGESQANYKHLLPSKSLKSYLDGIKSVPQTIFVNEEGYQIGSVYVGAKSQEEWEAIIIRLLEHI